MPHHPTHLPDTRADKSAPVVSRSPTVTVKPSVLEVPQRVLFVQRLALLIDRIRTAAQEDKSDER
jgi:septal ring-binding cell division protein DamX